MRAQAHLFPALPNELRIAVINRANMALEDELIATSRARASLKEIAPLRTIVLATSPRVALKCLLTRHRVLGVLILPARQQRCHQRLL